MIGWKGLTTEHYTDSGPLLIRGIDFEDGSIHLRRDNKVSVRYAEALNSGKSSDILQRADRHEILGEKPPDFPVSL
jgi:hypothetical protein